MEKRKKADFVSILVLSALVAALAIIPFFVIGEDPKQGCCGGEMPVTHDLVMHLNQMQSFYRGLESGLLYPRWQEETNLGFGAPTTIFYPPLVYYLTSLVYFLFRDWMITIEATYYLLMLASGLAFFALSRRMMGRVAALVAMIVYMIAPYHLINHYQRGALAECLSFIWMPLILACARDLLTSAAPEAGVVEEGKRRSSRELLEWMIRPAALGLSVCWGLFILSHPPTAYQFMLISGPVAVWLIARRRLWASGVACAAALGLGTMLAGVYIIPAILEQHYIHSDDVEKTWPYHESYVFLFNSARYDHLGDDFVMRIDHIWLFTVVTLAIVAVVIRILQKRGLEPREGILWVAIGVYTSLMMTLPSKPLGMLIPRIEIGVFSWRMLTITTLVSAILTGYLLDARRALPRRATGRWAAIIALALLAGNLAAGFWLVVWPMVRAEAFKPNPLHANFAMAPRQSGRELPSRGEVDWVSGSGRATVERWDPEYRRITIDNDQPSRISIRTFDFPGWSAAVDGSRSAILRGLDGEICLDLGAGRHTVELEFVHTRERWIGLLMTLTAVPLIGAGFVIRGFKGRVHTRRN